MRIAAVAVVAALLAVVVAVVAVGARYIVPTLKSSIDSAACRPALVDDGYPSTNPVARIRPAISSSSSALNSSSCAAASRSSAAICSSQARRTSVIARCSSIEWSVY
jgi:hypothetical protein